MYHKLSKNIKRCSCHPFWGMCPTMEPVGSRNVGQTECFRVPAVNNHIS